jgi:hypothetical protein
MAIHIELTPEEEARLRERAEQRGEQLESLAGAMLRTLLLPAAHAASTTLAPVLDEAGVFHQDRWERVLASIETGSACAPVLPPQALTRESFYCDHD